MSVIARAITPVRHEKEAFTSMAGASWQHSGAAFEGFVGSGLLPARKLA
jgi:hypothetical protein